MKTRGRIYEKAKQAIIICVCVMMLVTILPAQFITVQAADGDSLKTIQINGEDYTTDSHGIMAYRLQPGSTATYDIYGKYNGRWIRTTYQYNERTKRGYVPQATSSNVKIKATPKFINEGRYIQLTYTLTSTTKVSTNFSIAADIMIDDDDNAPITAFSDGSGFKMVNRYSQAQFNFYGKNVYGTNPGISTYWFGYYSNRDSYRYTQTTAMNLANTDSAMGCSWKNLSVDSAGVDVSMIVGTGEANTAPEVGEIIVPDDSAFVPGKDVTITVPVENATGDNAKDKLKLYYSLLKPDGSIIDGPNLISDVTTNISGAITNFVATFQIPNYMPSGPFVLRVFAMNAKGGISAEVSKSLTAKGQPINITSTSGDVTTTIGAAKTLDVTLTSSSTVDNPLIFQWQKQVNGVYVDIDSASQSSYQVPVNTVGSNSYRVKVRYKNDTTSTIYSTAMNVTVDKAKSTTSLQSSFDEVSGNLSMTASVTPSNGQSANGNEVKFYNGNTLLGKSTISNDKATLVLPKEELMSGPYTLQAIYAGNATMYSSSSSATSLNVNLTMQILYDQFIQASDSGVLRSYKEGIETILKDPTIAREGYAFLGWLSATGDVIDRISATLRGDVKLTSQWKKTSFEVTLDDNLGSPSITSSHISNQEVSMEAPVKTNYTFTKWVCSEPSLINGKENNASLRFTMPEKDVSLVAQYRTSEYAISYRDIETQANWASSYTYGSKKTLPTPSKANALFLGWHKNTVDGEIIKEISASDSGAITLYPAWSQLYQVTIKNSVQGNTQTPIVAQYPIGEEVIMPSTQLTGYAFEKWRVVSGTLVINDPQSSTLAFTMPSEDVEVEAVYQAISYPVQYQLDGGVNHNDNPESYAYGSRIDLKQPTKEGYRFDGWFSDASFTQVKTAISQTDSGATTVYAKWTKNAFLLTLNDAIMEDGTSFKQVNFNEAVTFHASTKVGYTFTSWQKSDPSLLIEDLGNGNYRFIMPNHPVSIKAEYEKTRFPITYHNVEGIDMSNTSQYPTSYVLGYEWTLKNPSKEGYEFGGWFNDPTMMTPFTKISATQTGALNAYGKWAIKAYKIDIDGGTFEDATTSKEQVNYQTPLFLKANTIAGMRFNGWYDQDNKKVSSDAQFTFQMPAKNVVLQARFEPETFTITYDVNAGAYEQAIVDNPDASKIKYTYGENYTFAYPTMKNSASETLMTFDGWKIKGTETKITTITPTTVNNLELVATWVPKAYTISYENIEGSQNSNDLNMSNEKYNTSSSAQTISLASPTKIGYEFTGWTPTSGNVSIADKTQMTLPHGHTGNITLHATWDKKDIPYSVDGVSKTAKIDEQVNVKLATLADGQEFVNWQVTGKALLDNSSQAETSFVMDATLIESIEAGTALSFTSHTRNATYTITYQGIEDAINNNPTTYVYGNETSLQAPSKVGYTFDGWTSDASMDGDKLSPQQFGDITLLAKWTPIDYAIVVVDGNLQNMSSSRNVQLSANIGDTIQITADEKRGYTFTGWSLSKGDVHFADAQNPTTSFTMSAGEVEIKATYSMISYTLSYMDGENPITTENPSLYTIENETIVLKDAKKDGYDFKGWYDNKDFQGDAITEIPTLSTNNKTYYAKFEKLHNTITFTQSGLGSYEVKANGVIQNILEHRYSTQERGLNVRVNITPSSGYSISKILVNGVEYDVNSDLRFDDFFGNYTIHFVFSGAPIIDTPTSENPDLTWQEGTGKEDTIDSYTKEDVEISMIPGAGTKTSYQIIPVDGELSDTGWLPYQAGDRIVLSEEGSYLVYIKSSDEDGNVSVIHTKGIVIDKTAPVLKDAAGNIIEDEYIIYTDEDFTIEESLLDYIRVNGGNVDRISLLGNQSATYTIVVCDKAGNMKTITVFAKEITSIDALQAIQGLTEQNVKKEDIGKLETALRALENLHATGVQKELIKELTVRYQALITYIHDVMETLTRVNELASEEGWSIEKEQTLRDALTTMNTILQKDNLNAEDKANAQRSLTYLKDKIALVEIDKEMEALAPTTQANVKSKQEPVINALLDKIKDVLLENSQLKDEESKNAYLEKQTVITNLKEVISSIIDKLNIVKDGINNQNLAEAMEQSMVEAIKAIIEELRNGNNLDETESNYVEDAHKVIEANEKVKELQAYDENTVTTKDRDVLHDMHKQIEDALKDNSALSSDKVAEVKEVLDRVQQLVDIVDDVYEKLTNIKDVIDRDLSKPIEKERLDEALSDVEDLQQSNNVLPEEKEFVHNSDSVLNILKDLQALQDTVSSEVNINQEQALKDLLQRIQNQKNNPALSKEKWDELAQNTTKIDECITRITQAKEATKRIDALQGYQDSNDVKVLQAYVEAMEDFLANFGKNLDQAYQATIQNNVQTAKEKIKKLSNVKELAWNQSEVRITGMDTLTFDKDVEMIVKKVKNVLTPAFLTICQKNLDMVKPGYVFDEVYEIELLLKNQKYTFDGRVEARIKLSEQQLRLGNLGVVYINDQGEVEVMKSRVENGYIIFETTHFSKYALIYSGSASDSVIKDTSQSMPQVNIILFAFACVAIIGCKKRKNLLLK